MIRLSERMFKRLRERREAENRAAERAERLICELAAGLQRGAVMRAKPWTSKRLRSGVGWLWPLLARPERGSQRALLSLFRDFDGAPAAKPTA
jgi:hypothetical protein